MLNIKIAFDNWIAADMTPEEFVRKYYLTDRGKLDLIKMEISQDSNIKGMTCNHLKSFISDIDRNRYCSHCNILLLPEKK